MSDCFLFRFLEPADDKRSSLVIFFSSEISPNSITKELKRSVEESLVPRNVYLLTMESSSSAFSQYKQDFSFISEFDCYIGDIREKLVYLYVKPDGVIINYAINHPIEDALKSAILKTGMISLFRQHKGVISSSPSYHFEKPSGDHCDKFIRASNLLVSRNEVAFLAISLLPYFKEGLKRIYVDTSSIAFLVNVAAQLSGKYTATTPLIESFESYAVFNKKFDFVEDQNSLVVISATTSGSLTKSLKKKTSFNNNQIITLFHLALPEDQIGIFNISSAVSQITSKKAIECEFCTRGSKIIRISGDQFLPETPKHELLVIRKSDFGRGRECFFKDFSTKGFLGWNTASAHQADTKEHFYIDVCKVLSALPLSFSDKLDRAIKRYVSRDTKTIIYLNDVGSVALSDKVRNYLGNEVANHISWLKHGDVKEEDLKDSESVMVVAGAITSGRKLLAVSRLLRCIDKSATITYLIGFSKLPTNESLEQLKKDLQQSGHEMVVLQKCPLPRIKENTKTAWDWEKDELAQWDGSDPFSEHSDKLPINLKNRAEFLASDTNDLNKLFLPNPTGNSLKLRKTFAFWSDLGLGDYLESATQSDVYWTISAVLHDLRIGSDEKGLASTYHTTLISPACFDRYNDGIIQACLLRAAKPVELNYAVDSEFSRQMTDVLLSIISNWENSQGEASLEFLLALWIGRLQLVDTHVKELLELKGDNMPEDMRFMMGCIAKLT